jgi:tetrapyrrole methylase family protein/MazG family protein
LILTKDVHIDDKEEILRNWDKIKRQTKGGSTQADLLRSVPKTLPALMRSTKVQSRAARVGFDWPDITGALEALDSEKLELEKAIADGDAQKTEEELGDLLFSAVNVSRFLGCDAEQALTLSCDKFIRRFELVESLAKKQGLDMTSAGLQKLDELWQKAKSMSQACGQDIT